MGLEENKKIVRELVERMSDGDSAVIDELTTDDFILHSLSNSGNDVDKAALKATNDMGHAAFPDYHMQIDSITGVNDRVFVRSMCTRTQTEDFLGLAPTGNTIKVARMAEYRMENGKIAEMWGMDDTYGQYMQLGIVGTPRDLIKAFNESGKKKFGG